MLIASGIALWGMEKYSPFPAVNPWLCLGLWFVSLWFVAVIRGGGYFEEIGERLTEMKIHPDFYKVTISFAIWMIPMWAVVEGLMAVARAHGTRPGLVWLAVMFPLTCVLLVIIYRRTSASAGDSEEGLHNEPVD